MSAEVSAEYVQQERARFYAWGRLDAESLRYVPSDDFVTAVMKAGATVAQFRGIYNRMLNERAGMPVLARVVESTKEAA